MKFYQNVNHIVNHYFRMIYMLLSDEIDTVMGVIGVFLWGSFYANFLQGIQWCCHFELKEGR